MDSIAKAIDRYPRHVYNPYVRRTMSEVPLSKEFIERKVSKYLERLDSDADHILECFRNFEELEPLSDNSSTVIFPMFLVEDFGEEIDPELVQRVVNFVLDQVKPDWILNTAEWSNPGEFRFILQAKKPNETELPNF